jgi:hypothetical protein
MWYHNCAACTATQEAKQEHAYLSLRTGGNMEKSIYCPRPGYLAAFKKKKPIDSSPWSIFFRDG